MSLTRIALIATDAAKADAIQTLGDIFNDPQPGALSVPLSESGDWPPTHWGDSGTYNETQVPQVLGYSGWQSQEIDSENPGPAFWSWAQSLGFYPCYPPEPE